MVHVDLYEVYVRRAVGLLRRGTQRGEGGGWVSGSLGLVQSADRALRLDRVGPVPPSMPVDC